MMILFGRVVIIACYCCSGADATCEDKSHAPVGYIKLINGSQKINPPYKKKGRRR